MGVYLLRVTFFDMKVNIGGVSIHSYTVAASPIYTLTF